LKDDNTIRKSMLKLVRMVQKLKNDKNRDDSLLFTWARHQTLTINVDVFQTVCKHCINILYFVRTAKFTHKQLLRNKP